MKFKFSEIFTTTPNNNIKSLQELYNLKLYPEFINKISILYGLSFEEKSFRDSNVCFAKSIEIRSEYRSTFNKRDILEIVYPQVQIQTVNFEKDEIVFPYKTSSFFSESYKKSISIKSQKRYLRRKMLEKRNEMSHKERRKYSEKICTQLWDLILKNNIQSIHSYLTMESEVNVLPLLQKAIDCGITVIVPKTLKNRQMQNLKLSNLKDMEIGIFNTYHPKYEEYHNGHYDLIIVAGLAFDKNCNRLGYGGGYYDIFLADQNHPLKVGVCYPFQIIDCVPIETHDIQLDIILD